MDISAGQPPGVVGPVAERNLMMPPRFCAGAAVVVGGWVVLTGAAVVAAGAAVVAAGALVVTAGA